METIKEALTFDDVLMLPRYSNVLPTDTNISLKLTNKIQLKVPFLSSAMDTVTESKMAIAIANAGGIGVIHRNINIKKQTEEIKKVKGKNLLVGAAIGTNKDDLDRARSLATNGVDPGILLRACCRKLCSVAPNCSGVSVTLTEGDAAAEDGAGGDVEAELC
mgnify:CR=1 FL=1